ncbi:MAG: bifunctional 3-(3-hydroxy-phenyl)propionate/3-hydroxycinnamic acid hydroxylase [Pseudomonadota bacterium]
MKPANASSGDVLYDVAVVGFGPAGAVAASLLGGQGLSVFVCDKSHVVYELPRAFALDHEIMRVFQHIGIAEDVLAYAEPFTPSEFFGVDGELIKRFTTVEPPYPLAYVPSLVFTQPPVERILRAHVQSLPSVEVLLGCEFVSLIQEEQDQGSATLQLRNDDGSARQVKARYVLGCDGASSPVRAAAGIALQDLGFDEPWLVVDVLVNDSGLAKLPVTSVQFCEPQRPCTFLIGPKNHRRWEISINEGEDPALVSTPEGTWKLLSRWITPEDATLWRQASYRFHALVADNWRAGRVFVAGDAAHQQPPFLGQGMCQGIRDVANLSWKLGAVLRGEAGDALLDSYSAERKAHVTELTTRIKAIGQLIGQRDVKKARERDARLLAECGGVVRSVPRQDVQPALQTGLLSATADSARGTIFPQPWLVQGDEKVRLDELAGSGWRLVLSASAQPAAELPDESGKLQVRVLTVGSSPQMGVLCEQDGVLENWFVRHGCIAALVRPDHYVFGTAKEPGEIAALIESAARQGCYQEFLQPA